MKNHTNKSKTELIEEFKDLQQQYSELKTAFDKNIAEKKRTEEALLHSEQKFFVMFEKSAFPTSLSKLPEGRIVDVNEAFEREFGLTKQEVFGKTTMELGIYPDTESRKRILEKLRKNGSVRHQEMVLRSKSGEECYYETNIDKMIINGEEYLLNTTQNIDEYKRAENKLKENYNLLQMAGEKAKLGGWNVILKGNLVYWSDEVAAIHEMPAGYTPPVEDGMNFYAPEWRKKIAEVYGKCALEGIPYDEEMEIINATGKRVWVRTIGEAVRDVNGKIVKVQGAFQDISFRKKTEEIIKKDKELLNNFFKQSLTGFFIMMIDEPVIWNDTIDKERVLDYVFKHQHFVKINQTMLDQYQVSEADFMKKTPNDLFAQDLKQGRKAWEELFNNGHLHTITLEQRSDGSTMWIEGDYICLYDSLGRITGHFGNQDDITEKKQAEEELLKSNSNLEEYFENDISADYVVSVSGEIFSCNKTFLNLFGFEKKSDTEKFDITKLYKNPKDRLKMIRLIKEQRKVENLEVEFISKDGKTIYALINAIGIFNKQDKLEKIRGYVVDITEQKNIEKELQISEKKYKDLSETVNAITWEYDLISDKWNYVSPQSYTILGYMPEEWENFEWWAKNIYHLDRQNSVDFCISESQLKRDHIFEYRFTKKDGTIIWLRDSVAVFTEDNKPKLLRGIMTDITEQQQTREMLQKSEEKYRLLFANNPQPMWIYDLEALVFLEVNQAAIDHYGYTREEFLSMNLKDIQPVEDVHALQEEIENINTNINPTLEWRHLKKKGEIIDVEITSHSLTFNDRNARHILIKDITKRKQAENEILKLSHAIEQNPASIIITDVNGNIEYANPKTLEITGYTKEELIGKNPRIFNSGEKPKEEYKQLWSSILSGKVWFGEFHNKKKNGELYWESASISPIFNEKNEIINYVAIKEDITERIRFEDTRKLLLEISQLVTKQISLTSFLAEVHQKFKQIIRADNFYVALYNETNNTFSFPYHVDEHDKVELNKPYDLSSGYTHYVLKSNQSLIITPKYKLEVEKDGTIKGYGDDFSVWMGVPFTTSDKSKPNGVIAIQDYKNLESYTDADKAIMEIIAFNIGNFIERVKYLEDLVLAKEKAEESDRLKSAFLANMSHEIRTPMNGILGFTQFLLEPDLSSQKKQKYIEIVHKSGHRMLNTVNDIVEISKIEAGIVTVSVKETDLNSSVEELIRFFNPEVEKKGLKLILETLLPEENKIVSTDRNKFDSILSNLLKNAIKYTESGMINVGCQTKGAFVEFYVKDTGIGIPKDRTEAVFERFVQADIADTMVFEGSGLGLAIGKSYVEMLGGSIWVESKEGKGSTFYFTLPVHNYATENTVDFNEMQVINENNKVKTAMRGLKILIAEDDEPSRTYVSLIIEDLSSEILEAETGIEAVELCRNNKGIDLILMDIKMPGLNGYEATRQIREFNKDVIIIAQTAYALSGDLEKAIEAGCNDYISKPLEGDKLLKMVKKYFK